MVPLDGSGEFLPEARYVGRCSGVMDRGLRFFPLVLLGMEGLYAASEFPSYALLSPVIGEPFWGGREGDLSLGVNRLDPPA
jgi:hypothetical protein